MKHMAGKGKIAAKKWGFRGKMWVIGLAKLRAFNQSRKAKWYKMQVLFLKLNISGSVKDQKQWQFTHFMAYIFARTERKLEWCCKIKDNDLRFELMSL